MEAPLGGIPVILRAEVLVYPKAGVLDTQGKAVEGTLRRLGHSGLGEVRVGRYLQLRLEASDPETARREVEEMCRELLANDLIEETDIRILPEGAACGPR
jgi:phosphoribosylformylglycinamidine synthase PurS subunit